MATHLFGGVALFTEGDVPTEVVDLLSIELIEDIIDRGCVVVAERLGDVIVVEVEQPGVTVDQIVADLAAHAA